MCKNHTPCVWLGTLDGGLVCLQQNSGLCRGGCALKHRYLLKPGTQLQSETRSTPAWGAELCSADSVGMVQLPAPINRDDLML